MLHGLATRRCIRRKRGTGSAAHLGNLPRLIRGRGRTMAPGQGTCWRCIAGPGRGKTGKNARDVPVVLSVSPLRRVLAGVLTMYIYV